MSPESNSPKEMAKENQDVSGLPDRQTLIAFVIFVFVSGGASVAIRITYAELPPFWGAAARFLLGALIFWILALVRKIAFPTGKALLGAVLFGALAVGAAFILIYWGLVKTPASIYQILMALVPLLTLFFAFLHRLEPLRARGLLGSLLAVVGIAIVVGGSSGVELSIPHILAIIAAAACMAEAGVIAKQFPRNHPIMTNAIAMTVGTLMLSVASLISGEQWVIPTQINTWIAFAYIVIFVTVIAFLLYLFVLARWTASGTSYGFVLIPLVTVILATWLAGEQITLNFILGAALVLAGVIFGALLPTKKHPVKATPPEPASTD